jgi:DNA (cytosine-5)-methyltransferase 1
MLPEQEFALLLSAAKKHFTNKELAASLGIDPRTVRRWEQGGDPKPVTMMALRKLLDDRKSQQPSQFTFADLFAGIGGIRLGFERQGGRCVFTSEWNNFAQITYRANFPFDEHAIAGDITEIDATHIPNMDVLLAGFPCQPFSIAGVSKKNALGRAHGFACETQGTLFFDVARIIAEKRPRAFVLENVKNLRNHDKGRTFEIIMRVLEKELGYHVVTAIMDGQHFVPQHRERIIIIGFDRQNDFSFDAMNLPPRGHKRLKTILHSENGSEEVEEPYTTGKNAKVAAKYTLTDHLWDYLQRYAEKHRAAGNGFGFGLVNGNQVARTLSARYYKDGSEILIDQGRRRNPRRLTPRECARLMGFPDGFKIPVSDTQAYRQFGNSVVVPLMEEVARAMKPYIAAEDMHGSAKRSNVTLNLPAALVGSR